MASSKAISSSAAASSSSHFLNFALALDQADEWNDDSAPGSTRLGRQMSANEENHYSWTGSGPTKVSKQTFVFESIHGLCRALLRGERARRLQLCSSRLLSTASKRPRLARLNTEQLRLREFRQTRQHLAPAQVQVKTNMISLLLFLSYVGPKLTLASCGWAKVRFG